MYKRFLSLLLVLSMVLSLVPVIPARAVTASSPASFSGLQAWYDATRITDLEDGDKISTLYNLYASGAAFDAVQADEAYQPTYVEKGNYKGYPAIRMDSDDFMQIGDSGGFYLNDMTIIAVMTTGDVISGNQQICSRKKDGTSDHNWFFNVENGGLNFGWFDSAKKVIYDSSRPKMAANTDYVIVGRKDGTAATMFVNGVADNYGGGNGTSLENEQPVYLGAPAGNKDGESTLPVDLVEFAIYDRALTNDQIASIQAYFEAKYAEPVDSPDDIDDLLVWYNASSAEGAADGATVTALTNLAGTGSDYDAAATGDNAGATYVAEGTLGGKSAIRLSAGTQLQIGGATGFHLEDMTVIEVIRPSDTSGSNRGLFCRLGKAGEASWYFNLENSGLNYGWWMNPGWCNPSTKTTVSADTDYVLVARKDGTAGITLTNGALATVSATNTNTDNNYPVYLGKTTDGNAVAGDLVEFMVFDRALTNAELEVIHDYIAETYGLDVTIDAATPDVETPEPDPEPEPGTKQPIIHFDATELELEDGAAVNFWENKANPGTYDAKNEGTDVPTYVAESSINGKPAVSLTVDDFLEVVGSNDLDLDNFSIFAVVDSATMDVNTDNQIFSKDALAEENRLWPHNWYFNVNTGGFNFGWLDRGGTYMDYRQSDRLLVNDTDYFLTGVKSGAYAYMYINGGYIGSQQSNASDTAPVFNDAPVYIGGDYWSSFVGNIGEILLFDRGLSEEEIDQVHDYLSDKWGIARNIGEDELNSLTGDITIGGESYRLWSPTTSVYQYVLEKGVTEAPEVTADFSASGATCVVTQAEGVPGTATIELEYESAKMLFEIQFSNLDKEIVALESPDLDEVTILDGFWSERLGVLSATSVKYTLDNLERVGTLTNFENVGTSNKTTYNNPWNDGLLYETIRAASDFMRADSEGATDYYTDAQYSELKAQIDGYIDIIYEASLREKNGILTTHGNIEKPGVYFDATGNPRWYHECYNFGCMAEAAANYYKATGNTKLLFVCCREAEYIVSQYGYGTLEDGSPKINFIPDHGGPEEMLLELYVLLRDHPEAVEAVENYNEDYPLDINPEDYADLVKFWIENRGNYVNRIENYYEFGDYSQDHARFFDQTTAAGHAVRANLFYYGIAAAGAEFEDPTYLKMVDNLWQNIVDKQMYITGGVGATGNEEAYGPNYDLPNTGYCESCAQAAMAFMCDTLGNTFVDSEYQDVLENYLYSGTLGSVGLNGTTWFYQQPLTAKNTSRWTWHGCPCCPPMVLKLYGQMASYIYSYNDDSTYINQYVSSEVTLDNGVSVHQETEMPYGGTTNLTVNGDTTLHIRLPDWADWEKITIAVNGEEVTDYEIVSGFALIDVTGQSQVVVEFPMEAKREYSHPLVQANVGKVAFSYGPLIYCFESTDNTSIPNFNSGEGNILIPDNAELVAQFEEDLLGGITTISVEGLYTDGSGTQQTGTFKLIPFYIRANRGTSSTFVWVDELEVVVTLEMIQAEAVKALEAYRVEKQDSDYRDEQIAELDKAVEDGIAAINAAESEDAVEAALAEAKAALDDVKTDAELTDSEIAEAVEAAKAAQAAAEAAQEVALAAKAKAEAAEAAAEEAAASAADDKEAAELAAQQAAQAKNEADAAQAAAEKAQQAAEAAAQAAKNSDVTAARQAKAAADAAAEAARENAAAAASAATAAEAAQTAQQAKAAAEAAKAEADVARQAAEDAAASAAADKTAADDAAKAAEAARKKAEEAQAAAETAENAAKDAAEAAKNSDQSAAEKAKAAADAAAEAARENAAAAASAATAAEAAQTAQQAKAAAEAAKAEANAAQQAAEDAAASAAADKTAADDAAKAAEAARKKAEEAQAAAETAENAAKDAAEAAKNSDQSAAEKAKAAAAAAAAAAQDKAAAAASAADAAEACKKAQQAQAAAEAAQKKAEEAAAKAEAEREAAEKAKQEAAAEREAAAAEAKLTIAKYQAMSGLDDYATKLTLTSDERQTLAVLEVLKNYRDLIAEAADPEEVAAYEAEAMAALKAASICPSEGYTDVDQSAWYHNAVDYMVEKGYMKGVSDTLFDVNGSVTRGQLVTILYRIAGEPSVDGLDNPFGDVEADAWYADAVIWAANQGIVRGVNETTFEPAAAISREQIVTILHRYAGEELVEEDYLTAYTDADSVSGYAYDAMNWAIAEGIINGMTATTLAPAATATRAQICAIMMRYLQK